MSKQTTRKSTKLKDSPRSTLFDQLHQFEGIEVDEGEQFPSLPRPSATANTASSSVAQELQLVQLQKEKLLLELEVLRLKQQSATPPGTQAELEGTKSIQELKKRVIDWPQNFVPGMSASPEFHNLDLPSFVSGFLAMIRPYDTETKECMIDILELISTKAISYSWSSVRGFYSYLARQVEQRRLDWSQFNEIRNASTTFFKHSDLKSSTPKGNTPRQSTSGNGEKSTEKGCQTWNYKGMCSCDKASDNFANTHVCRVCKASDHPMLNCPKRKMPIPDSQ
ncbi:uncharacterized protein LOC110246187 [Exaiptasia diaphana]|uniref:Uncharacterized protein n=1 Tax=Exaiptasia diaphana TaxID=2652724 RepID=A0A913XRN4_EXADI|nr:uncharacterized protein LOC110246187 [Exaiptasia diaphana]